MASSSPPVLPISTTDPPAASVGGGASASSTSVLRLFVSRLSESARRSLAHRRPWSELVDRSALCRPESLTDATHRLRRNLSYFRVNYLALLAVVVALSLLSHPASLLLLLALFAAWSFLYLFRPQDSPPLVLLGRTFSDREVLGGLVLATVLVVFLTNVGSLLISALLVGVGIVCLHGSFRLPEDLFLDDQEPGGAAAGFLNFLGGAASSASASASGPAVRV